MIFGWHLTYLLGVLPCNTQVIDDELSGDVGQAHPPPHWELRKAKRARRLSRRSNPSQTTSKFACVLCVCPCVHSSLSHCLNCLGAVNDLNGQISQLALGEQKDPESLKSDSGGGFLPHIPSAYKPVSLTSSRVNRTTKGVYHSYVTCIVCLCLFVWCCINWNLFSFSRLYTHSSSIGHNHCNSEYTKTGKDV